MKTSVLLETVALLHKEQKENSLPLEWRKKEIVMPQLTTKQYEQLVSLGRDVISKMTGSVHFPPPPPLVTELPRKPLLIKLAQQVALRMRVLFMVG